MEIYGNPTVMGNTSEVVWVLRPLHTEYEIFVCVFSCSSA